MTGQTRRGSRWRIVTVALGVALTGFALAHSLEDFAHAVPQERFGIEPTPAAIMLAAALLVQGAVIALAWRGSRLGYAGCAAVGLAWLLAAGVDHAGDLVAESFRTAFLSDALIAGILASSALLTAAALAAFREA